MGGSLNDPKILSRVPSFSTPSIILPVLSVPASPKSGTLNLHDILYSKIRPHLRLTHVSLSRYIISQRVSNTGSASFLGG